MRHHYERLAAIGEVDHELVTWEADGTISAMTDILWAPFRRTLIEQQITGVRPDARGRGLGKWIKAAMVLHVRDLYPDAEWIVTGTHFSQQAPEVTRELRRILLEHLATTESPGAPSEGG